MECGKNRKSGGTAECTMKHPGYLSKTHAGRAHGTLRTAIISAGRKNHIGLRVLITHILGEHHTQRLQRVRHIQQERGILTVRQVAQTTFTMPLVTLIRLRPMLENPRAIQRAVDTLQPVQQVTKERRPIHAQISGKIHSIESAEITDNLYSALSERVFEALDFPKRSE